MLKRLFTVGYEGASLGDFVQTLKEHRVDYLLDVRELPLSRRRGFSKNQLREVLLANGIAYRHERQLGSPRDVRRRLYADKDYVVFFREFRKHLNKQESLLKELAAELSGTVALVCFERDYRTCHRKIVAAALAKRTAVSVTHVEVESGGTEACEASYPNLSQGFSAA